MDKYAEMLRRVGRQMELARRLDGSVACIEIPDMRTMLHLLSDPRVRAVAEPLMKGVRG